MIFKLVNLPNFWSINLDSEGQESMRKSEYNSVQLELVPAFGNFSIFFLQ